MVICCVCGGRIAQDIFLKLHRNNYLLEDSMKQLLCEKCKM